MKLRSLRPEDQSFVSAGLEPWLRSHIALWAASYGHADWTEQDMADHVQRHNLVDKEWREIWQDSQREEAYVAVLEHGQRAVGVIQGVQRLDNYFIEPVVALSWIYIEPTIRGCGHSQRLMRGLEQWARRQGVKTLEVFVTAANERAVRAYRKSGFRAVDWRMLQSIDFD